MSLIGRQGFGLGFPPPAPAEDVGGASESPQHQRQNDDVLLASSTQRQQQRKDPRENLRKQYPKYGGKIAINILTSRNIKNLLHQILNRKES